MNEVELECHEGPFHDYSEVVVQFGYVNLFSVVSCTCLYAYIFYIFMCLCIHIYVYGNDGE
jgi:hypothetical protein